MGRRHGGRCGNVKSKLMKDFESAKSANEMHKAFQKLEKVFDEKELGKECWKLAVKFYAEGKDFEKVFCFANRALKTLTDCEKEYRKHIQTLSLLIASVLTLLGEACYELGRFEESLSYLNWSNRNFHKLELDNSCPTEEVLRRRLATETQLVKVKVGGMVSPQDAHLHLKKILEIKERILEKDDCMELGKANMDVTGACIALGDYKGALPYCLKAIEIHAKHLGQDSVDVAGLRWNLGTIYSGLGDYEMSIEQNQLAQSVLVKKQPIFRDVFIKSKLDNGDLLVRLGRYQEALDILKGVVSIAADNERHLALAFVTIARAFCGMGKYLDAKKHMKLALRLFDNNNKKGIITPDIVEIGLWHMTNLYEDMKDFENAISMLSRLLRMTTIPQETLGKYSTRYAELIMHKEKALEGQGPSEEDKLNEAFALLKPK